MNIKDFMVEVVGDTKEVTVTDRFKEPFVIESITETENDRLKKANTVRLRSKGGNLVKNLDTDKYGDSLVTRCIKEPDLANSELQGFYGTEGDETATLKAMLLAGEYASLMQEILEFNGFDQDDEELKEEAKK